MVDKDEKQYAADRELEINEVKFDGEKGTDKIRRVRLMTSKGWALTYKPSKLVTKTTEYKGIEIDTKDSEAMTPSELEEEAKEIFQIHKVIEAKGICKIKISYSVWNKNIDGVPETYRYFGKKQLKEMKILDSAKITEEIVE